ncbi:MAG: AtpZ/AtpI family protein [Alphaproteobacteria bacterium]|nr:AtpZ/AtpI family protein [Alphaproteobacteria bacterium]
MARNKVQPKNKMTKIIAKKVSRRVHAQKEHNNNWRMTSFFGLIGFSVIIPLFACILGGVWLDKNYTQTSISWTVLGIFVGLLVGGFNAWRWIQKEEIEIEKDK